MTPAGLGLWTARTGIRNKDMPYVGKGKGLRKEEEGRKGDGVMEGEG